MYIIKQTYKYKIYIYINLEQHLDFLSLNKLLTYRTSSNSLTLSKFFLFTFIWARRNRNRQDNRSKVKT